MNVSLRFSRRMKQSVLAICLSAAALWFPGQVAASDDRDNSTRYPYASLHAEAVTEVARDTVRITLVAELSDAAQAAVASGLTEKVDSVMGEVKGKEGIKVYSGNFQIWPMNDQDGRISNWRGRAEIILESTDFEAASKLAAQVSDRMPIANVAFSVAPRQRARYEAELMQQAATAFRERAQALATSFGFDSYTIRKIQVGGAGTSYQPESRAMMAKMSDAAAYVPLEGGTERISLSVEGSIFLHARE